MTTQVRRAHERGHARHGWLESYHTFSFAGYYDPAFMGFGALRVINEDRVRPGKGFDAHSHRDMEIVSYVIEGALEHRDSLGNGSVIRPGEVQLMRAGTGVTHSEYNASSRELVHFLQIWIVPDQEGLAPGYDQRIFPAEQRQGQWRLVASRTGEAGSIRVQQDVSLYATLLEEGQKLRHPIPPKRRGWLQVVRGELSANGTSLAPGDGLALIDEEVLEVVASSDSEALFFELA